MYNKNLFCEFFALLQQHSHNVDSASIGFVGY